ncbi:MAG TPA: PilZ domain-containing protein, partial [Gammaproteobacteria bacterium]
RAEPPAGPRGQLLAVAAVRTVRLLGHELLLAYAAYQDPPKRVWLELNSLYRFAEQSGFAAARVPQPGHSRGESSVLDSYLQLLLLARHDPYRIPAGEVWQVYHYLDQWAGLCRLEPVDSAAGNDWCVDLDRAQPDATDGGGEHLRRIVPRALQQHLERQLVTLRAGSMPESLGLGDEVGVDSAREILKRMQRTWFAPDERRNQRHAKSDRVRVLCGLSAICRGHDEPEANAPADEDWILGKGQQPAFEMGNRRADPRYLEWHVLNRSRGGLMLRTGSGHGRWLSIGQLVAIDFRLQEQPQWLTCAVRWLRFGRDERVELGVQFVSARARPVTVRYREEDGGRPVSRQALLIDGEPDSQLIGDRGLFSAERFIEIPGQQPARFVTSRLLETTRSYQRIQISPLLSTRRS